MMVGSGPDFEHPETERDPLLDTDVANTFEVDPTPDVLARPALDPLFESTDDTEFGSDATGDNEGSEPARESLPSVVETSPLGESSPELNPTEPATSRIKPLAKGTLARNLVIRMASLVAVVAILLSAITTFSVHTLLMRGVDQEIRQSLEMSPGSGGNFGQPRGPGAGGIEVRISGQNIIAAFSFEQGQPTELTTAHVAPLLTVPADGEIHTIWIPDFGEYRAGRVSTPLEDRIVAISTASLTHTIQMLILVEIAITVLAVLTAILIVVSVIRSSLKPLYRLTETATIVSELDLSQGEVTLAMRVPEDELRVDNEVGRVGQAFNHMLDNVEGALAARQSSETRVRQFVADASHELRNPLASIRGYSELMGRRSAELDADSAIAVTRISAESKRMSALVEDMMLLARLDNGVNRQTTPVDLVEIVLNATQDARAAGPNHVWTLTVPDYLMVSGDANQLHQVIANLLGNARKHTPAGTRVEVSAYQDADEAVISVLDNGPGVPDSIKDQVFERFARADVNRAHDEEGSTGLGLAIVASVAQAHGGTVELVAEPGATRFVLRLPLLTVGSAVIDEDTTELVEDY